MRRMPKWVKDAVFNRAEGRCGHQLRDGRSCGRQTELWYERKHWTPEGWWDPADYRLVCLYHLQGGHGLKNVDWRQAARA